MREPQDPRQLPLFPELSEHASIPSITTLPEFDRALNNLIKMSDLGAFIQLNIQGLEKVYTLNLAELDIPADFLRGDTPPSPVTIHLFPSEIRNQLKKFVYEIKSFFNNKNSFRTSFGYFLFRPHFTLWKHYLDQMKKTINDYLYRELSRGQYGKYFLSHFQQGYDFLKNIADITAPWEFHPKILLKDIDAQRKVLMEKQRTVHNLKPTEVDYPFELLTAKTQHVPMVLHDYITQIQISAIFKTIHLEYLADKTIQSIDDIRALIREM
jgi:pterin-4a-carbinolamine dehydratase